MAVSLVRLGGRPDQPLLLLGASDGTSVRALWGEAAGHLARDFQVVGWDLPGHGTNSWVPDPDAEPLTVADLARGLLAAVDELADSFEPARFHYAGVAVSAVVGLQLVRSAPERVVSATLLGPEARLAGPDAADDREYAGGSRVVVLDDATDPAPGEDPARIAALVRSHALGEPEPAEQPGPTGPSGPAQGQAAVGLAPRDRSIATLAAVAAGGHPEQLPAQVRTARANGLSIEEIREVLQQTAVLGDEPAARSALRIADQTLAELGDA